MLRWETPVLLNGVPESGTPSFDLWRSPKSLDVASRFRSSVVRGSDLFFGRRFQVPAAVLHNGSSLRTSSATCATCHQGSPSRWMDIGTTNRPDLAPADDLPLFRITCVSSAPAHPLLGRVQYTEDPGRALVTGKCADVGSIVMQQLRGLSARAPYSRMDPRRALLMWSIFIIGGSRSAIPIRKSRT
jgi:hypothetical protein